MLKVVMEYYRSEEGYFLKHWFLMHRNKKNSLVKQYNIWCWSIVLPSLWEYRIIHDFYLSKRLTVFAEDWVQHRTVPWRQMPTLQEKQFRHYKNAYELLKQKYNLYKKKKNFEKLNDNRPGHIYVKCPKFACINF